MHALSRRHHRLGLLTPAVWMIHLGGPVVPEEYRMYSGWLNGSCSKTNGVSPPVSKNADIVVLSDTPCQSQTSHSGLRDSMTDLFGTTWASPLGERSLPLATLGSRTTRCKPWLSRARATSATLGTTSNDLPAQTTSVSENMILG